MAGKTFFRMNVRFEKEKRNFGIAVTDEKNNAVGNLVLSLTRIGIFAGNPPFAGIGASAGRQFPLHD